jgi:hypothetical protein
MTNLQVKELFQSLTSILELGLNEKRQHDVLMSGVLAYLFFHAKNEATFETASLMYVRKAVDDLLTGLIPEQQNAPNGNGLTESSLPACSFCGRKEPEVRLVAGAGGFICNDCVKIASEALAASHTSG